ncbi:ABC transporter substrate-binding protein [Fodinicola acaciae]|uniref:ABC transporter substrate-binding protein n=1 Tax=Fodinicola acaciae TaxID=2681555 RepID=UPI0013D1B57A|nr:extracellular solute-binding protein [Fodinicola acaciae]
MRTPSGISRRALMAAGVTALAAGAAGCGSDIRPAPPAVPDQEWRRFAGTTINFISENTAPTVAIAANLRPFTELTGIEVNIAITDLGSVAQRVALDFASGDCQYHVIYADPYQILAPYAKGFADLREFIDQPGYPKVPGGIGDFVPAQLDICGRFGRPDAVYALPYDCPTMIWHYRADIFAKYHDAMANALGFDPTPRGELSWDQYFRIAGWLNDNVKEIPYGTGHMAKQHDSLGCDFLNVLVSYGGDYFHDGDTVGKIGKVAPGPSTLDSNAAIAAAEFYQKLLKIAHPGSAAWDWDGVTAALRGQQIVMCPNWHENAAGNEAALPGKIAYAPLPRGPKRSAHIFGGTGIGINGTAKGAERGAAWLFANWATQPSIELANLASKVGGGTPTRTSVYAMPEVVAAEKRPSKLPNMLSAQAVKVAWEEKNIGRRPKIPMWGECNTAQFTELSKMVGGQAADVTMRNIRDRFDRIVSRGWSV